MRFDSFEVEGTASAGGRVIFSCVDGYLRVEAAFILNGASVAWPASFAVPCLALTGFHVDGKETRRGVKRERYREVTVELTLWDGPTVTSQGVDFGDDGQAETALIRLNHQVAAANLKWPMSSSRAMAARRATVPGRIRSTRMLGLQGREEFSSPFDRMPAGVVDAWASSELSAQWPLGAEAGWSGGSEVYCAALAGGLGWICPTEATPVRWIPFSEVELVDLQVRREESGHAVGLLVRCNDGSVLELWRPYGEREAIQQMYRFALNGWAAQRPFDEGSWLDEIERLEAARGEGGIDAVSFATAVSGLARRVAGDPIVMTYPWAEERYIRPPVVQPSAPRTGAGVSAGQAARAGVGIGLLAAAAANMMDE